MLLSTSFTKLMGMFSLFLLPNILQPSDYGMWLILVLIASYAPILCFGTVETLLKQYPFYYGMNDIIKIKELENGVFSSLIISTLILLFIAASSAVILRTELEYYVQIMFLSAAICFFSSFFSFRFVARQNFKVVSYLEASRAFITFAFLISFSYFWGLKGTILGFFITEILIFFLSLSLNSKINDKLGFNFNPNYILKLIKIGLPITLVWWAFMLQSTVDRLISMSLLGKTETGYYGLGVSIVSVLILIPQIIGRVLYPKINESVGKNLICDELYKLVVIPTKLLSMALPLLIGILLFSSPWIYKFMFPKYMPGLYSAQILFLGSFFLCLIRNGANFIISKDKQLTLLFYAAICLIANTAGSYFLIKIGMKLEGIAISTTISGLIFSILVWRSVFDLMGYSGKEQWKQVLQLMSPFILFISILLIFISQDAKVLINYDYKLLNSLILFILLSFVFYRKDMKAVYNIMKL